MLLLHGVVLWAVQQAWLRHRAAPVPPVVPVMVLSPPAAPPVPRPVPKPAAPPLASPTPQAPRATALPQPKAAAQPIAAVAPPAAAPAAAPLAAPAAVDEVISAPPVPSGGAATAVSKAPATAMAAPAAAPRLERPSNTASYLYYPKPRYPRLSRSRNEQGTVVLSVRVGADGRVRDAQVKSSSGFELLDRAAQDGVQVWTFVPAMPNGVPIESTVEVPIPFRLTD